MDPTKISHLELVSYRSDHIFDHAPGVVCLEEARFVGVCEIGGQRITIDGYAPKLLFQPLWAVCFACSGTGVDPQSTPDTQVCPVCNGPGKVYI